jgi:preprotein translocase subunit YajC
MGIEELHDAYTGSISNDLSTILTTQNGFKYSSIPLNTSCLYTKPKNTGNSVVFIVFFSIFTGIFGVVVIALSAYCLIKQCERRRKVSTNSEVVLNGGNVGELQGIGDGAIVIGMIGTENVIRMKDAGGNGGGGESES